MFCPDPSGTISYFLFFSLSSFLLPLAHLLSAFSYFVVKFLTTNTHMHIHSRARSCFRNVSLDVSRVFSFFLPLFARAFPEQGVVGCFFFILLGCCSPAGQLSSCRQPDSPVRPVRAHVHKGVGHPVFVVRTLRYKTDSCIGTGLLRFSIDRNRYFECNFLSFCR